MKIFAFGAAAFFAGAAFAAAVTLSENTVEMPTYPFFDPDPVPCTGEKRYPYFRYDGSSRESTAKEWKTIRLDNGKISVDILSELGGKVWGATDKATGFDFIYRNHVAKFRDVAMRGPWTSGGIEWNFGIIGHAPSCSTPVDWFARTNSDGSASCFVASEEYATRTRWQVEIHLAPEADSFETRTTWFNASGLPQPCYHWANAAFSVRGNPRFLFSGEAYIGHEGDRHAWPVDSAGRPMDTYGGNAFGGNKSYHVLPGDAGKFGIWWPERGLGAVHLTDSWRKYGRKIWLWALSREGGIWEDLLTDEDGQYTELQSGRGFNQPRRNTYKTPFKHPEFNPGATETFAESWGVVRKFDELEKSVDVPVARPDLAPQDFDWRSAWGLCVRARQHLLEREDAEAEKSFKAALAKDPFLSPALTGLAAVEIRRGEYGGCHALCRRALAIDAYDTDANSLDGFAFFAEGEQDGIRAGFPCGPERLDDAEALEVGGRGIGHARLDEFVRVGENLFGKFGEGRVRIDDPGGFLRRGLLRVRYGACRAGILGGIELWSFFGSGEAVAVERGGDEYGFALLYLGRCGDGVTGGSFAFRCRAGCVTRTGGKRE